jgi:hypothetical protein
MNSTDFGHLKWLSLSRAKAMMASASGEVPGFRVTKTFGTSPHFSSGTPTTATSWTRVGPYRS